MGKSGDKGNTTMPLSKSQVVSVTSSPPPIAKHDQSTWGGLVVGTDDFAPRPTKPRSRVGRWLIFGALGAGAVAGGIYAFYPSSQPAPAKVAPPPAAAVAPVTPDAAPAPAVAPLADAAIAEAMPDAAPDAAPEADAVSSVAPSIKPKKPATKKPTRKKHH